MKSESPMTTMRYSPRVFRLTRAVAGNIVVMDEGRVLQTGPTSQVYHNPATLRVAEVFSDPPINYLGAQVQNSKADLDGVQFPIGGHLKNLPDGSYTFGVRANRIFLSAVGDADVKIDGEVELSEINGSETFIHLNYRGSRLVIQEDGIHKYKMGGHISFYVNPETFFAYDGDGRLVASPDQP